MIEVYLVTSSLKMKHYKIKELIHLYMLSVPLPIINGDF
jgi:hypothetical protein